MCLAMPDLVHDRINDSGISLPPGTVFRKLKKFTPDGRLTWEQKLLPDLAREVGANLLHSLTGSLPLTTPLPCVISPAAFDAGPGGSLLTRIVAALGHGGSSLARALFWPEGLPEPAEDAPVLRLPNTIHSAFSSGNSTSADAASEPYIFCPGPVRGDALEYLAAVWGKICAGLGEDWALAVDGISNADAQAIRQQSGSTAQVWPALSHSPTDRARLMQNAAVVLCAGTPSPWGDPMLQALACGRPVAAEENEWNALRAGPAAYLTPPGDARLLGAAALTLAVEESVAEALAEAALVRAQTLRSESFPDRLLQAYWKILS